MLNELGVSAQDSDMSFSVNNLVSGLQYNPSKNGRYLPGHRILQIRVLEA